MHTVILRAGARRIIASALAVSAAASGLVLAGAAVADAAQPAAGCQSVTALDNGGFETPVIPAASYSITPASTVPGWETTDPSGIEIWSSGFLGVPAAVGSQFAELNATQAGTLFQEVATQPGQALQWSLLHRGRGGTDVMDVLIGAPGGALASQGNLSDGTSAWGRHTGIYIVPAGQTVTRFGFRAVSTGSGDNSIGNFLDDISFGTGACVVSGSAVSNATRPGDAVHVGDVVEYTVTAENQGGSRAILATLSSALPVGLDFVPGSLRTSSGPSSGQKTDAAGDDSAEYTASTRAVTSRLGAGATATEGGALAPQETTTFVFRAIVTSAAALSTVSNAFTVEYTDSLSGMRIVSPTPVISTPVAATVDLGVVVAAGPTAPVAGASVPTTFTVTASNAGPQTDTGVMVSVTLPSQFSDLTVTLPDGTVCPIASGVATCTIGGLSPGSPVQIRVAGTVGEAVPAGTPLAVTASIGGTVFDGDSANNTSSAMSTLTSDSDLWMWAEDDSAPVRPGQNARMRFTVGNTGASTARDIAMRVEVPEGFAAVPSAGTIDAAGVWTISSLAAGETQSIVLRGRVTALGHLTTAAWLVSSTTTDGRLGNERAVAGVFVEAEPETPVAVDSSGDGAAVEAVNITAAVPVGPRAGLASTGAQGVDDSISFALFFLVGGLALVAMRYRRSGGRHRA